MVTMELFFIGLLVAAALTIAWFAFHVAYRLYRGQR